MAEANRHHPHLNTLKGAFSGLRTVEGSLSDWEAAQPPPPHPARYSVSSAVVPEHLWSQGGADFLVHHQFWCIHGSL